MRWFLERKGARARDDGIGYHVSSYRPSVRTQYVGEVMDLLVSPDALKSIEFGDREEVGVDEDIHDGPVALAALRKILRKINRQRDTIQMTELPQMLEPTVFCEET